MGALGTLVGFAFYLAPSLALALDLDAELKTLRETVARPPAANELMVHSDAHYFLGKYEQNAKLAEEHLESSVELAGKVLASQPDNPAALLAWAAAKGELAQRKNPFTALGYIRPVEKRLLHLKEIAPAHEFYVADRALGRLYQLAPGVISIGSKKKARTHLKAALDGAPDHPANQVYWALFLQYDGDKYGARLYANKALANSRLVPSGLERFDWQRLAEELLKELPQP